MRKAVCGGLQHTDCYRNGAAAGPRERGCSFSFPKVIFTSYMCWKTVRIFAQAALDQSFNFRRQAFDKLTGSSGESLEVRWHHISDQVFH